MTSEAGIYPGGRGFAPHGNLLATASLPAGENFTFMSPGASRSSWLSKMSRR